MRLLTRSDFDGLACAVLLTEKGIVDDYTFVHPKDLQDGVVTVTENDVLANVPYVPGCGLWFDHHTSEGDRLDLKSLKFKGRTSPAASAAQVIWEYYDGCSTFGDKLLSLLKAVNIADTASFTPDEVKYPTGWVLLSFIMDPRTGLGYFKDYRISNYQLMLDLIGYCRSLTIDQILAQPDVKERVDRYFDHQQAYQRMLREKSRIEQNVIITNLLDQDVIYCGNRFIVYALNPDQNMDIRIMWGKDKQNVVIACGHSILNLSSRTNIGSLMLKYGGGGHTMAGTCQVPMENWEQIHQEIVAASIM